MGESDEFWIGAVVGLAIIRAPHNSIGAEVSHEFLHEPIRSFTRPRRIIEIVGADFEVEIRMSREGVKACPGIGIGHSKGAVIERDVSLREMCEDPVEFVQLMGQNRYDDVRIKVGRAAPNWESLFVGQP